MAESKRSPRWRYLGAAGGVLGALVVIFALLTAPAPVQPVHRVSLKSEDVGSQTATTPTGSKKTATDHTVGTTTTHGETSTTSNPLARASHAGAPSSGTTTSSTAAHAGAIGAALGASGGGPGTTTSTAAGANPASECSGTTPPVAAPAGGWQCTFDDEFNGTSLDTSKWQPQLSSTSGYSTGAAPDLVCYVDNPQTISESGGTLNLSVVQTPTPQPCGQTQTQYEGGMVSSYEIFSQRYGFFEARAKLPASTLDGLQETLWLYPENETLFGPFPDSGEIDYGEFYSEFPTTDVPVVHYPGLAGRSERHERLLRHRGRPRPPVSSTPTRCCGPRPRLPPTSTACPASRTPTPPTCRDPMPLRGRSTNRSSWPSPPRSASGRIRRRDRHVPGASGHDIARLDAGLAVRLTAPCLACPAVQFSKELHDDIAAGDITVTFRLWRRRQVKVGGRYRVGRVEIEVDSMDLIPFGAITTADVRLAGEPDRETLRRRAAHAGPIDDDTPVYRIAFHVVT